MKSRLWRVLCFCMVALPFNANSVIIDNGYFTTDTESGLDWFDLTATAGLSSNQVVAELEPGGA